MINTMSLTSPAAIDRRPRRLPWMLLAASMVVGGCGGGNGDPTTELVAPTAHVESATARSTTKLAGGTLVLRIGGAEPGVSHDVLNVAGNAELAGTLSLEFTDGYKPVAGQRFALIKARSFTGGFIAVNSTPAYKLSTSQDATNFYVTVSP